MLIVNSKKGLLLKTLIRLIMEVFGMLLIIRLKRNKREG
jgi:hypothetical protein